MRSRLTLVVLLGLIVAALGHGAIWWVATSRLLDGAETAIAAERASGAAITHGTPLRGGYPLDARVTLPSLHFAGTVAGPGGAGVPIAADASAVTLVLSPGTPRLVTAEIVCPCRLGSARGATVPVEAASLRAEIALARGRDVPVLRGRDVVFALPDGPVSIAMLRATAPEAGRQAGGASVAIEAQGITLPAPDAQYPLGRQIGSVTVEVTLRGLLPASGGTARALAGWRDAGGALLLDRIAIIWGPLTVRAAGTVSLDAALQPRGIATAWIAGFGPTLDRLVAAGLIGRGPAALTRLALTAASRPGEGGGERVAEIPLMIEERMLTAARVPILRLPFMNWPER